MSRDLRAVQEFSDKGRQMLSYPHWPLVPLSLKLLRIISRAIRDAVLKLSQRNISDYFKTHNKKEHVVLLNERSLSSRLHNPVPLPLHFLFSSLSSISKLSLITICITWRHRRSTLKQI